MRLVLEVVSDAHRGRRIWLDRGQSADVGRTERSFFVFPNDRYMSSRHFRIECSEQGWIVLDLDSTHGTSVNGTPIQRELLRHEDRIVAGTTAFQVTFETGTSGATTAEGETDVTWSDPPPVEAPRPIAHVVGDWSFRDVPDGWVKVPGQGIRRVDPLPFPITMTVFQLPLPDGVEFADYVRQMGTQAARAMPDAEADPPEEIEIEGADEAFGLTIRQNSESGTLLQRLILARRGKLLGMATLNATADSLLDGAVDPRQLEESLSFGEATESRRNSDRDGAAAGGPGRDATGPPEPAGTSGPTTNEVDGPRGDRAPVEPESE